MEVTEVKNKKSRMKIWIRWMEDHQRRNLVKRKLSLLTVNWHKLKKESYITEVKVHFTKNEITYE